MAVVSAEMSQDKFTQDLTYIDHEPSGSTVTYLRYFSQFACAFQCSQNAQCTFFAYNKQQYTCALGVFGPCDDVTMTFSSGSGWKAYVKHGGNKCKYVLNHY